MNNDEIKNKVWKEACNKMGVSFIESEPSELEKLLMDEARADERTLLKKGSSKTFEEWWVKQPKYGKSNIDIAEYSFSAGFASAKSAERAKAQPLVEALEVLLSHKNTGYGGSDSIMWERKRNNLIKALYNYKKAVSNE